MRLLMGDKQGGNMNERLVVFDLVDGEAGVTLGANYRYFTVPCDVTVVYVTASPSANDTGLNVDINDDGSGAITAIVCAVKDTPGTWISTHFGGAQTPVRIAADSKVSLDANAAAADTVIHVQIWALSGEAY